MDVAALLAWYRTEGRDLPWRREVAPWRTLVSELMCQQTRVETVIPYFHRFMEEFPTPEAMAAAGEERVLELWSGLGYYSRARNLYRAACTLSANGGFPRTHEGLLALPGVGPYTAGAIGAIAFGMDLPVVDGNVERVFSRFYAREDGAKAWFWERATALLPPGEAGDYNQGLMELGATLCTPRSPRCLLCPVRDGCAGKGDPERYPAKKARKAVPRALATAFVLREGDTLLLGRRPPTGLLAGLWELPGGTFAIDAWADRVLAGRTLGVVAHTFTHLHVDTTVVEGELSAEVSTLGYVETRWVTPERIDGMALSTLARKTLRLAGVPVRG